MGILVGGTTTSAGVRVPSQVPRTAEKIGAPAGIDVPLVPMPATAIGNIGILGMAEDVEPSMPTKLAQGAALWELVATAQSTEGPAHDYAISELFRTMYAEALKMAHRFHPRDYHAAEDLAQAATFKFMRAAMNDMSQSSDHPNAVLYNTVRRTAIDEYRSREGKPQETLVDEMHDSTLGDATPVDLSPEEVFELRNAELAVNDLLSRLHPALRLVVELHVREGLTDREAAAELGTTPRFVRKLAAQALAELRELVQQHAPHAWEVVE